MVMEPPVTGAEPYLSRAALAISELDQWFRPRQGVWKTAGWWNSANILTAIIRYDSLSGSAIHRKLLPRVLSRRWRRQPRDFINEFNDDEGWWASAWLEAYILTGESRYLAVAERLYADISGSWSEDCGGGIFWKKGEPYKAAIANSLFIYLGARLYSVTGREDYLRHADRGWSWFTGAGLLGSDGLVRDGLGRDCEIADDLWTYNQGMLIGAASRLSIARISRGGSDPDSLVELALKTAHAAMESMAHPGGVLREYGEPDLNVDSVQFKGIMMRFLADLWLETADEQIRTFVMANADSIWTHARKADTYLLGGCWQGPFDAADAARQGSAIDALVAAATVAAPALPSTAFA